MSYTTYILMGAIILSGLIMLITNKPLFLGTWQYTEESLKKFPRPAGLLTVLFAGFGMAGTYTMNLFFDQKLNGWVCVIFYILTIIFIIAYFIVTRKILVKKPKA